MIRVLLPRRDGIHSLNRLLCGDQMGWSIAGREFEFASVWYPPIALHPTGDSHLGKVQVKRGTPSLLFACKLG